MLAGAAAARHPGLRHTIPALCKATYRRRNVVERGINRLNQYRAIATRYAKRGANYRAMVVIASILIWLGS